MNKNVALTMIVAAAVGVVEVRFGDTLYRPTGNQTRVRAAAPDKEAAPVPPDARVKPDQVHGMKVEFYDFYPKDAAGIDSLDIAKRWIAGHKPDVTYSLNVQSVDFPPGPDGTAKPLQTPLGHFLLGEKEFARRKELAAKGTGPAIPERLGKVIGSRTIYVFTGFIKVEKPGTYKLMVPCDDQAEVTIGGIVAHARPGFGGMTAPDAPENVGRVEFVEAGIYPIKVLLYDREPNELGIEFFSDLDPKGEKHQNGKILLPFLQDPVK